MAAKSVAKPAAGWRNHTLRSTALSPVAEPSAAAEPAPFPPASFGALLLMFGASGCAALIYQIVWLEQLSLAIGSSALSLGVLLATFMGGLGLGSLLATRAARAQA